MADVRLWPHQDEAATATTKLLAEHPRAHLVAACGTGKTLTCAEIARRAGARRRLIVVPTLELAGQLLGEWRRLLGGQALGTVTGVCSSQEVVRFHGDLDAEVTTSPDVLAARADDPDVTVISTYTSLPIVAAAHTRGLKAFDIAVADEAHRSVGPVGGRWTRIHDAGQILADRRLYATATPRLGSPTGSGAGGRAGGGNAVVAMEDERVFGPRSFTLSFGEAIKRRLLAEYRFAVSVVTDARIRELILSDRDDPAKLRIGEWLIPADMAAAQIALLRAAAKWDLCSVITFHARRDDARRFAATLPDVATLLPAGERPERPVRATFVHGAQHPRERARRIERLRDPGQALNVVANVRVLGEGVDVPAVDGVMFCAPTRSVVLAAQAVGRALRLGGNPDKVATIIVPVHLHRERAGVDLADEGWEALGEVAAALAAHDERLAAHLADRRRRLGADRLHPDADVPELLDHEREHDEDILGAAAPGTGWLEFVGDPPPPGFSGAVRVHAIRAATDTWEEYYGAARAYYAAHGNLLVPDDFVAGGLGLGRWIQNLRSRPWQCAGWQRNLLDEIGMVWNPRGERWEEWFQLAAEFKDVHGHLRIPVLHKIRGRGVGHWLARQKQEYASGRLDNQRAERLIDLGMELGASGRRGRDRREAEWKQRFELLRAWLNDHPGAQHVSTRLKIGTVPVGKWWDYQVRKLEAGTLSDDRAIAVRGLTDKYGLRLRKETTDWGHAYDLLENWLGTAREQKVPFNLEINGVKIYDWFRYQIKCLDSGKLSAERAARLRELAPAGDPHVLLPRRLSWDQNYEILQHWLSGTQNSAVTQDPHLARQNIYNWLTRQLHLLDQGKLTTDQADKITKLAADGDPRRLLPRTGGNRA